MLTLQLPSISETNLAANENVQLLAPIFIDEPPSRMHFSNTTGTVITCSASTAIPPVKVWWILADSQTIVTDVAGLRYVRPNGQLVFPPFALDQYRQDIHSMVGILFLILSNVYLKQFFSPSISIYNVFLSYYPGPRKMFPKEKRKTK